MADRPIRPQGPRMEMRIGISGRQELQLRIGPPVANSVDEVIVNARAKRRAEIGEKVLQEIGSYVVSQDSDCSDEEVLMYMHGLGYDKLTPRDVSTARKLLEY